MKRSIFAAMLVFAVWCSEGSFGAAPRFIKVSGHCYYLQLKGSGENVAAVVTDDGVLIVNPPQEPDLSTALEALANVTSKTVRWVVFTEPRLSRNANTRLFAERNTLILTSARLQAWAPPGTAPQSGDVAVPSPSRLVFEDQMRLFPSNVEVRIVALKHKARTGGDMFLFVPGEKVLFVGRLFEAGRYTDIDTTAGGNAIHWMDGMRQVIDLVPLLKSAIPAAKPNPKPEPEKTMEEAVTVISARGEASNLRSMKDLLESCRRLRNDISRAFRSGRTCDGFLASAGADAYRNYSNLDSYAAQLYEALAK